MRHPALLLFLASLTAFGAAPSAAPPAPMHAGPLFTSGEAKGPYPRYPELQIEIDIPPDAAQTLRTSRNFRLSIDQGSPVEATSVQSLGSTNYGVAVIVCLDVSGSMKGAPLDAVRAGLAQYVSQAGPRDKMAVQTIADDARWDTDFGDPPDKVRAALRGLSTRGSLTRLWDGLLIAIDHLPATPLSHRLVVISDGHDEGSVHTLDQVITAAHEHSLVIDSIGVTRSSPIYLRNLAALAAQTGGTFRQARNTAELEHLVGGGITEAKSTPVVTFRPDQPAADGRTHHFLVTWLHDGLQSKAELSGAIPAAPTAPRSRWVWIAGIALAAILAILIAVSVGRKKRSTPPPIPVPVAAPTPGVMAAAPAPAPARPVGLTNVEASPRRPDALEMPRSSGTKAPSQTVAPPPRRVQRTQMLFRFSPPTPGHPITWLACEEGLAPGQQFPVDQIEYWIGAADNNHLRIADDPTVSGNHACLVLDHEVLGIHDHHSTNGTRVNDELVGETRRLLRPGDRIRIGRSTFRVQAPPDGDAR
ncbi:MAG TPA: FHA domain-containing protein [Acidobacteriaceae bacterium]|jgi:Mg-chelatase subunit ChlD